MNANQPEISLTQASIINQSSAVLLFKTPNLLASLAATNTDASTKVVVVTMKTALPRESCPLIEDIEMIYLMRADCVFMVVFDF